MERHLVVDLAHVVEHGEVHRLAEHVLADALDLVDVGLGELPGLEVLVVERADRIDADDLDRGFCSLRYLPAPLIVPPVPRPATKTSKSPSVCFQISGPVER